jgi:hypothetical protein
MNPIALVIPSIERWCKPDRNLGFVQSYSISLNEEFMKTIIVASLFTLSFAFIPLASKADQAVAPQGAQTAAIGGQNDQDSDVEANLAKLSPDDRKLAEAQKFCAIQTKNRLGSMGVPVKLTIKDQPVFLCCGGCVAKAKANPEKTLATVAELIKANK